MHNKKGFLQRLVHEILLRIERFTVWGVGFRGFEGIGCRGSVSSGLAILRLNVYVYVRVCPG